MTCITKSVFLAVAVTPCSNDTLPTKQLHLPFNQDAKIYALRQMDPTFICHYLLSLSPVDIPETIEMQSIAIQINTTCCHLNRKKNDKDLLIKATRLMCFSRYLTPTDLNKKLDILYHYQDEIVIIFFNICIFPFFFFSFLRKINYKQQGNKE